ncbi:helix-turn-helix transcriptional regulator [Corynebacterium guangdongense]|uniref:Site-specific integrase-resolvase n=1 Tax=Corynebacterium guangdongense TaxID=1783348 RepID=A0ABU1ZVD1_9CORY|nr:helix-turn-helix domain-containing protein [Corynebacterium guangdongense]MDR7328745.1 putative site-specific integrase-resolvase [Corynebacterium guangdongense]WJZ17321.1 Helix-turn-helix domain protein [Corynebacterium guangdongense]
MPANFPPAHPYVLDTIAAAEYLGLSPKTLRNWKSQGRGPRVALLEGSSPRYRVKDLEAYVDAQVIGGGR